ncbi:MAG: hypothetical protein ACI9G1_001173, partial [Pirellulaceae bacterium]
WRRSDPEIDPDIDSEIDASNRHSPMCEHSRFWSFK